MDGSRYQFTGREHDAETGLQYNRARYYNAALGLFLSEDPIGFAGGDPNLVRYVMNNPSDNVDPSGNYTEAQKKANAIFKAKTGADTIQTVDAANNRINLGNILDRFENGDDLEDIMKGATPQNPNAAAMNQQGCDKHMKARAEHIKEGIRNRNGLTRARDKLANSARVRFRHYMFNEINPDVSRLNSLIKDAEKNIAGLLSFDEWAKANKADMEDWMNHRCGCR